MIEEYDFADIARIDYKNAIDNFESAIKEFSSTFGIPFNVGLMWYDHLRAQQNKIEKAETNLYYAEYAPDR